MGKLILGDMISSLEIQRLGEDVFRGLVRKLITAPGTGPVIPESAEVTLTLSMFVVQKTSAKQSANAQENDDLDWRHEHSRNEPLVRLLCNIMPVGLQEAVKTMSTGEAAYVWVHPAMAYGSSGLVYGDDTLTDTIPPNSALVYEVCLMAYSHNEVTLGQSAISTGSRFGKMRFDEMHTIYSGREKVQELLKNGQKVAALRTLCGIVKMLESMRIDAMKDPHQNEVREKVKLDSLKVAAELAIELGWFRLAVTFSKTILEGEYDNAFAHYLLGRAYFALGCNSNAKRFLRRAHLQDMNNEMYSEKLAEIERHMTLLDESDSEDALEDYEELADIISKRLQRNIRRVIRDVDKQIQEHVKAHRSTISIKGGFSETILNDISNRLVQKNKGPDSVIVKELYNELEINIP